METEHLTIKRLVLFSVFNSVCVNSVSLDWPSMDSSSFKMSVTAGALVSFTPVTKCKYLNGLRLC